jgi:hypothetical protein
MTSLCANLAERFVKRGRLISSDRLFSSSRCKSSRILWSRCRALTARVRERESDGLLVFPIRVLAACSALVFHASNISFANAGESLSTNLAQVSHSHMPFDALQRSFSLRLESNRGPPGEAAVMWAATPTLIDFDGSLRGPDVSASHSGLEQRSPTLWARVRFTD